MTSASSIWPTGASISRTARSCGLGSGKTSSGRSPTSAESWKRTSSKMKMPLEPADRTRLPRVGKCVVAGTLVIGVLATATAFAQAPNSIESIEVTYAKAGRTIGRLQLAAPAVNAPASSTVNNPPKITLDFTDTVSGFKRRVVDVDDVVLKSVNIVPDGNRTKVVFNLNKPQFVEAQVAG